MTTAKLYPQATQSGIPIPDAIALPQGYIVGIPLASPVLLELPGEDNIVSIYVTDACVLLLDADNDYVEGAYKRGGYILLPGILYSLFIVKDFFRIQHIGDVVAPRFYVNVVQPWGGAGQQIEAIS